MYEDEVNDSLALIKTVLETANAPIASVKYKAYSHVTAAPANNAAELPEDAGQYTITLRDGAQRNGAVELLDTLLNGTQLTALVHPVRHTGGERMLMVDLVPQSVLEQGGRADRYCTNGELCMLLERGLEQMKLQLPEFTISPERGK